MHIARVGGLSIKIHPAFILVLILYAALGLIPQAVLVFGLVIGHELAHLFAAKAYGFKVVGLEIFPFGGAAYCEDLFEGRKVEESIMALAGPFFNLVMIAIGEVFRRQGIWQGSLADDYIRFNFWLAAFNLIPVLPLDGGRVVRALATERFGYVKSTKALAWAGQGLGVILGIIGVALITQGIALEGILTFLVLAGFFWLAGNKEVANARITFLRQLTRKKEELVKKGLMRSKWITVYKDTPLIRIVEQLTPDHYAFVALPGDQFEFSKALSETEILDAMLTYGIYYPVGKLVS
ncbi:MAG: M50 family metallopeptidase [Desulfitobacterium hafniense]|nr:M50 family metallopeptidase [Desulfitobacterium hafniense]